MTSNQRAGRRGWEIEPVAAGTQPDVTGPEDEVEIAAIAAWFGALPAELRAYLDREAQIGRQSYRWP
jgi:hypothetical protein